MAIVFIGRRRQGLVIVSRVVLPGVIAVDISNSHTRTQFLYSQGPPCIPHTRVQRTHLSVHRCGAIAYCWVSDMRRYVEC